MVLALVDDLFFLAKIQETARIVGIEVQTVQVADLAERLAANAGCGLVVDLNHRSGNIPELIRLLKSNLTTAAVPVVGFLSHVQAELAASARAAGCDMVLPRSVLAKQLPDLLAKLNGPKPEAS
jgi:CheY-like chemotaxis protein